MIGENSLSMDQIKAVLDNAPVAIYVSALDSWNLLYANQKAKTLLLRNQVNEALTCYQAAGYDQPCPFCHIEEMNQTELQVREFQHPLSNRIYQLSGKLIDWADQPAHIEYIIDITERKSREEQSRLIKEELQRTFSSIPSGLCVYRYDGTSILPLFHNPAFYDIMGYSEDHIECIEQETTFLGVHPDDLALLQNKIRQAIQDNDFTEHTYRVWNDRKMEYRWIHISGVVKEQTDGSKLLYGVYSDVSERMLLEKELTDANEKMQDIVNAIPGGVAIYKMSDVFETVYYSEGVPALSGYTVEEYQELAKQDAAQMTYWEDTEMVVAKAKEIIASRGLGSLEFRKQHRDGHLVWVRAQIKWVGEEDGCPLLHCVFHNITDIKEAHLEMDHLVNSIPGGIASYRVEGDRFITTFYSDGVIKLSKHNRQEFEEIIRDNALDMIYAQDRGRVLAVIKTALESGEVMDVSFRIPHKDGSLIWVHLNGRRMGPLTDSTRFYAVFTGMSAETRLFQSIANETADGIYVIDKENYDLLYTNESQNLFTDGKQCLGEKCYAALHGKNAPCEFCTLNSHLPDGQEHEMVMADSRRFYTTRFRETDWNGIPAYTKYVRDVTEEVITRREKERLEMYFQNIIKNLSGGVSVIRYGHDGSMEMEFISDGFAAMLQMSVEETQRLYAHNVLAGIHPDDVPEIKKSLHEAIRKGEEHCDLIGRIKRGDGGYVWIKSSLTLLQTEDGVRRLYSVYTDISKTIEDQEQIRRQYNDLIIQHYRTPGPNALVVGHCNITRNQIIEIIDYTDSDLLKTFGSIREQFFIGLSSLIVDQKERQLFLDTYLNAPSLAAFMRNDTEQIMNCFIKLPQEEQGRYVQVKMNLVATPDSGGVTGILTVTDITEQVISERIMQQLSISNYDFVIDLNLDEDRYKLFTYNQNANCAPGEQGIHSQRVAEMTRSIIVPKDKERYAQALAPEQIRQRLQNGGSYTFAFSVTDENGDIRTKNITVSAIDLQLGRVCLMRTDITDSVREQQGLLNMIAYTFEQAAFLNISDECLTLYTRQTVLENLSPYIVEHYNQSLASFTDIYGTQSNDEEVRRQFHLDTLIQQLTKKPEGYDFVFPYPAEDGLHYKQVNVLWGDDHHRTICLVRADVTDMLAAERQAKNALEKALELAEKANQAKGDFLSAMSHDIRTPMNAIMGMTTLANAHLDDQERVADCLNKITISSKHLLSLINDILDMSKIERSKITLNQVKISLTDLLEQLSAMIAPQAQDAGLQFSIHTEGISHPFFYGDPLRINQIMINLLSNALKFTPEGGRVEFMVDELPSPQSTNLTRYRFTIRDTGIGIADELLPHIFEPFTRGRCASRIEGTGLGLSVTKGLVDLMDGIITVESRINQGSIFQVDLECEIASAEPETQDRAVQSSNQVEDNFLVTRCFLIAEDNAINAEILCELLNIYGANTVVKTNGAQAVQAFRESLPGTYDAILMDIQMPELNGYEATYAIRAMDRPDAKNIPIVAMTANAFSEDIQASIEAGMCAHVAKPIDIEVLRDTLRKVLQAAK